MRRQIVGAMPKSRWGGDCIREQDYVLGVEGISMSIPATYDRHPFKIMEIVYETDLQRPNNSSI
jgi:hypothetical protein